MDATCASCGAIVHNTTTPGVWLCSGCSHVGIRVCECGTPYVPTTALLLDGRSCSLLCAIQRERQ